VIDRVEHSTENGRRLKMRNAIVLLVVGVAALASFSTAPVRAQSASANATPASPTFDVASIKLNKSGDAATTLGFQQGGRFRSVNETLVRLIGEAYATAFALPRFQIVGGPAWIDADRFDVDARPGGNPSSQDAHLMLRTLLADRFKLALHSETRELPIYNLVPFRRDGKLGDRLHPSNIDCAALRGAGATANPASSAGAPPCIMNFGRGSLSAKAMSMSQLANMGLARAVNRPVVDRTGLQGAYDWTLEWTPNQSAQSQLSAGAPTPTDPDRPSIFTAVQEQLGLKLESTTGPVDVLVIDHVEQPTPD
jgi:uncharacterized protein (TIGR03435 family)